MARELRPHIEEELEKLNDTLFRAIQSSHLNFLLGAGASCPGVITAGDIETDILSSIKAGKTDEADKKTVDFLKQFSAPMTELLTDKLTPNVKATLDQYIELVQVLDRLLSERKTALLPKQATICLLAELSGWLGGRMAA